MGVKQGGDGGNRGVWERGEGKGRGGRGGEIQKGVVNGGDKLNTCGFDWQV